MWRFLKFLLLCVVTCTAQQAPGGPKTVNVTTPDGLQAALRAGVPHVVITKHLDLTGLPRAFNESVANTAVAFVAFGTVSIRVGPNSDARSCPHTHSITCTQPHLQPAAHAGTCVPQPQRMPHTCTPELRHCCAYHRLHCKLNFARGLDVTLRIRRARYHA